jgi:hypothetical protein
MVSKFTIISSIALLLAGGALAAYILDDHHHHDDPEPPTPNPTPSKLPMANRDPDDTTVIPAGSKTERLLKLLSKPQGTAWISPIGRFVVSNIFQTDDTPRGTLDTEEGTYSQYMGMWRQPVPMSAGDGVISLQVSQLVPLAFIWYVNDKTVRIHTALDDYASNPDPVEFKLIN